MPDPITARRISLKGLGTDFILASLEKNLLKITAGDNTFNPVVRSIIEFTDRVKKMGEKFGINQPPVKDAEDMDIILHDVAKIVDQLRKAGKERQALAESNYAPKLESLKNEHQRYTQDRNTQTTAYNTILSDLEELRALVANPKNLNDKQLQAQEVSKRIKADDTKLATSEREFSRLHTINDSLLTRGAQLKVQVSRDASVALTSPTLKPQ